MFQGDKTGALGYNEFRGLWTILGQWKVGERVFSNCPERSCQIKTSEQAGLRQHSFFVKILFILFNLLTNNVELKNPSVKKLPSINFKLPRFF